MAPINVRVGHDDDAVIAQFIRLVLFNTNAGSQHRDESDNLLASKHFVKPRFLNV